MISKVHKVVDLQTSAFMPGEKVRHLTMEEIERLQMFGRASSCADAVANLCRRANNKAALHEIRRQVVLAEDSLSQGILPGRESQGILPDEELLYVTLPLLAAVKTALYKCSSAEDAHVVKRKVLHGEAIRAETQARRNQALDDLFVASKEGFQRVLLISVMTLKTAAASEV